MLPLTKLFRSVSKRFDNTRAFTRSCDDQFFASWSSRMAYWFGFLCADGCVSTSHHPHIHLGLKCNDFQHVQKFQTALQSSFVVGVYKTNRGGCRAVTSIYSQKLTDDLIQLGCINRKSLTLEWPKDLPPEFANHFVRGYFDGDGCLSITKKCGHIKVEFTGSKSFIVSLRDALNEEALKDRSAAGCLYDVKKSPIVNLAYSGKAAVAVLDWMHHDSDEQTRLTRKSVLYRFATDIHKLRHEIRAQRYAAFSNSVEWRKQMACDSASRCPYEHVSVKSLEIASNVAQIDKKTGCLIKIWDSAKVIHKQTGLRSSNILTACRGSGRSCGGYRWEFR